MKAALYGGPRSITVGERPDAVIKEPTDAVVRVREADAVKLAVSSPS